MLNKILYFLNNVVLRFITRWIIFPIIALFPTIIISIFSLFKYIKNLFIKK